MSSRRVPVNAASLLVGRVFGAAVSIVVVSLAAHRLDTEQFGLMASVMAAGFLVNSLITFGTDTVVTRAIAAERDDAVAITNASLRLQLIASLVLGVVAVLAFVAGADLAVLVQAVALVPMAAVTVSGAVLRGNQRMDQLLIANVGGGLAALAALLVGFSRSESPWVPIAALAIGSMATAMLSLRFVGLSALVDKSDNRTLPLSAVPSEAAPFATMVVLAAIGAQAGLLLVEFASEETAGGYAVAIRVNEAARLVPAAAMGAFFPAMLSGLHRTQRYARWIRWLLVYGAVATGAMLVLAGPANRIVFDSQPNGAVLIRILALGLLFTIARLALSFELIADGHERSVLTSALLGAVVTVFGGLVVVSRFGGQGVAWAQFVGVVLATASLARTRSKTRDAVAPTAV